MRRSSHAKEFPVLEPTISSHTKADSAPSLAQTPLHQTQRVQSKCGFLRGSDSHATGAKEIDLLFDGKWGF